MNRLEQLHNDKKYSTENLSQQTYYKKKCEKL